VSVNNVVNLHTISLAFSPEIAKYFFIFPPIYHNISPLELHLSEAWLKAHRELQEYVAIPGYVTEFRHREEIKGGGLEYI
jgi:hypothetical protein